ncbi:double-time [Aspergillus saccharolyticus JOP 1030-1]|uniref:non-specific serine/threonine protein kinase n=1 Tax=Aspergillus saccharolyticus JOP 1030-1 TaxID=1450539 RepID=A0A318ZR94_9EURO|nr:double-time [Aspergillus saccharolyticus JOP 1030-1]PYH46470.1 double-time [Aspergillus saccharolyticus JOP 1030-1]
MPTEQLATTQNIIVASRFKLLRYLGGGGYGEVFLAQDLETTTSIALKLEPLSTRNTLEHENLIYTAIRGTGIPKVYLYHPRIDDYRLLAVELLGPTLEDLFNYCSREFSLKTVLMLADQLLVRMQHIHTAGYIHQDIKPENLLMGRGRKGSTLYINDFGLARRKVMASRNVRFWRGKMEKSVVGTFVYASRAAHLRHCQTYRDDMECVGYTLVEFLKGKLPWDHLDHSKHRPIGEAKQKITVEKLCEGLPDEFQRYFHHIYSLRYNEMPDYEWLRGLFRKLFARRRYEWDYVFDWTEKRFYEMRAELGWE